MKAKFDVRLKNIDLPIFVDIPLYGVLLVAMGHLASA